MKFILAMLVWVTLLTIGIAQESPPISQDYKKAYQQAAEVFRKGDYDDALVLLDKAEQIQAGIGAGYNLKGAIYTKQSKYAEAEKAFQKAYELDPKFYLPLFNLGEVVFLQKQYEESHKRFEVFVQKNGNNDLAEFKLYLCDLLGDKMDRAEKTLLSQSPSPSTPLLFYMKAAWNYKNGNEKAALEEIQSAVNVYPAGQNNAFAETFIDLGWLKRKEDQPDNSALPETVLSPTVKSSDPVPEKPRPVNGLDSLMPSLEKEKK